MNEHYIYHYYIYIAIYHQLILIASNNLRGSKESRQTWPKQKRFRAWSPTPVAPVGSPSLKVSVCRSAVGPVGSAMAKGGWLFLFFFMSQVLNWKMIPESGKESTGTPDFSVEKPCEKPCENPWVKPVKPVLP